MGYTSRTLTKLLNFAFNELVENVASIKVPGKVGMTKEGMKRKKSQLKEGRRTVISILYWTKIF